MEEREKIKFLCAGGTIGMRRDKHGSLVPPSSDEEFRVACLPALANWQQESGYDIRYEYFTNKDSTNITPFNWRELIEKIYSAQEEGYSAVAISHGTDTLSYTATALAFGLHGIEVNKSALRVPVVITGAQSPIYEFGGDGFFNLQNLFRTTSAAIELGIADVLINFGYDVLLGCRALKVSERAFNAFEASSSVGVAGAIDAYGVHLHANRLRRTDDYEKGSIAPKFSGNIIALDLSPGTDANMLLRIVKDASLRAIILKSPGEGNICTEEPYNLLNFIEHAVHELDIPVLIASKYLGGSVGRGDYELGREALRAGAIACYDTTDVAVEVKLRWLIGNEVATEITSIRESMGTSYIGEVNVLD